MTIKQFNDYVSSSNLFSIQNGIWYSSNSPILSYPENGNDDCFELEDKSYWFHHRNNCLVSVVKRYSPSSLFFDVGGGNGIVTKAFENAYIPCVLIEPGKQGVLNAKKRNLKNIFCGSLSDLKGLTGQINSIGAFDVIEHIKDDNKFIEEINGMLKSGGALFVTVPAFQFLWSHEDTDAGHFRRYNKKKIIKLLENNGFDIVYSSYFFCALLLPLYLIRTLPSKLNLRNKTKIRTQNEHNANRGFVGKLLESIWEWELRQIKQNKSIPFGTSCLVVAIKK